MSDLENKDGASLWLTIESDQQRKVFTFRPQDDHAIIVGSEKGVHFRIADAPALCFYVEKAESRGLQIAPAYVGHLRLNSHRITDAESLPQDSVVEFGRYQLRLGVRDVPPAEDDVTVMLPFTPPSSAEPESAQDDATVTRIAEFEPLSDDNDGPTAMLDAPVSKVTTDVTDAMEFAHTEEQEVAPRSLRGSTPETVNQEVARPVLADDDPALATQIMGSVSGFDEEFPNYEQDPSLDRPPAPLDTSGERTEGIPFTDFVPQTGKSKAVSAPENGSTLPRNETAPPVSGPEIAEGTSRPRRARLGFSRRMEQLGSLATEKPVLALGGGVAVALLVGLSIGGVSKLLSSPESVQQSVAQTVPAKPPLSSTENGPKEIEVGETDPTPEPADTADKPRVEEETLPLEEAEARVAEEKAYAEEVNRAVEHLIAGRDDEAAQAYQSAAQTKYATEQLRRMSELLQKRNQARHKTRPATHQVPELYR